MSFVITGRRSLGGSFEEIHTRCFRNTRANRDAEHKFCTHTSLNLLLDLHFDLAFDLH